MELKVGMYVMTNDRMKIGQIKGFCTCAMCEERGFYEPIIDGDIIITDYDKSQGFHGYKFYDNPIDLIEAGDYVNGKRVYNISIVDGLKYLDVEVEDYLSDTPFINADQIMSIVTKEQFDSMKYEVE